MTSSDDGVSSPSFPAVFHAFSAISYMFFSDETYRFNPLMLMLLFHLSQKTYE